jgi:hypothetical protein
MPPLEFESKAYTYENDTTEFDSTFTAAAAFQRECTFFRLRTAASVLFLHCVLSGSRSRDIRVIAVI